MVGKRTTTTRHKNDNTFRFERFEDKLRKINVSVSSNIRDGRLYKPEENETYFYQAVEKCCEIHTTEAFEKLLTEIGTEIKTLTQVLHQKDHITSVLQAHLTPENRGSLTPLLELTIALARDLQKEFYPALPKFLKLIIEIVLTSKDSEEIEKGFQCFAYLFKYLRPQVVKDFGKIFKYFIPLLSPKQKRYVVIFACESFEIVASKVAKNSPASFFQNVYQFIQKDPLITTGIGGLLFYMMKGPAKSLRDFALQFSDCLQFINTLESDEDKALWVETLRVLVENLLAHLDKDKTAPIWTTIETQLLKAQESGEIKTFENLLQIYKYLIQYSGSNILDIQQRISTFSSLTNSNTLMTIPVLQIITELVQTFLTLGENEYRNADEINSVIFKLIELNPLDLLERLNGILNVTPWYFVKYLIPLSKGYHRVVQNDGEKCKIFVRLSSDGLLISKDCFYPHLESKYFTGFAAPAHSYKGRGRRYKTFGILRSDIQDLNWNCCSQFDEILQLLKNFDWKNKENYEYITGYLLVHPRVQETTCEDCPKKVLEAIATLSDLFQDNPEADLLIYLLVEFASLKGFIFNSIQTLSGLLNAMRKAINFFEENSQSFSLWMLKSLDILLYSYGRNHSQIDSAAQEQAKSLLADVLMLTKGNLICGFKMVRTLTLSIQIQWEEIQGEPEELLIEFYKNALDLEEKDQLDINFPAKVKELFNRVPVLLNHAGCSLAFKEAFVSYIFGFMYVNNNQVWEECIKTLLLFAQNEDYFESFWEILQKPFKLHYSNEATFKENILKATDRGTQDFINLFEIATFDLSQTERRSTSEIQERLDHPQYKANLWRILTPIAQRCWKLSSGELLHIIKQFLSQLVIEDFGMRIDSNTRENTKILIPILKFLTNLQDGNLNKELWSLCLHLLISPQNIRVEVLNLIFNLRKNHLTSYKETITSFNTPNATDSLGEFRADASEAFVKDIHRESVLAVVIRLLIGREKFAKKNKIDAVIRFISSCTENEATDFLNLYIGKSLENWKEIGYKYLEVRLYRIGNILQIWKYTFPNLALDLLSRALEITSFLQTSIPQDNEEELKRRAIKAARSVLNTFFELYQNLDFGTESYLYKIFDIFIWPELGGLKDSTSGGVNWILKIFNLWSLNKRFHPFLAYSSPKYSDQTPADSLIKLLSYPNTLFPVKKYILDIFSNLVIENFTEDENMEVDGDVGLIKPLPLAIPDSTGYEIIRSKKKEIFSIFEETLFFRKLCNDNSTSKKCLALITKLAGEEDESESEKIAAIIIDNIQSFNRDEESLMECLITIKKLLSAVPNPQMILLKLGYCFTWIKGRRLRKALCDILDSQPDNLLRDTVQGINSFSEKNFENPDFTRRGQSFSAIKAEIQSEKPFQPVFYTIVSYNCFHYLLEEPDFSMRNIAINILEEISIKLSRSSEQEPLEKESIHQFIEKVILTRLKGGIQHKDERKFHDFLRVLSHFIKNANGLHGTFKELLSLFFSNDNSELNILEGLRDIKVHKRTRAMNSLYKKLEDSEVSTSPSNLISFLFPLANHNLLDEEKLGEQKNELIDASINVIKSILLQVPFEHYSRYLINLLDNPKKNSRIAKQFERILIATMDAFHYDLSIGSEFNKEKEKIMVEGTLEDTMNVDENGMEVIEETPEPSNIKGKISEKNATKALRLLRNTIIPKLRKYLNFEEKATHKLSRSDSQPDEDVILKIPCTLALVKLLKKLPQKESSDAIRSIIPCLCAGLKNKLHSVREALKNTLLNVIKELGIWKFPVTVHFLKASLQRGYQKHVLHNTVFYLARSLEKELIESPQYFPLAEILKICEEERFGDMNEEKDVSEIREKTREARIDNASPLLRFCGMFAPEEKLNSLILPVIKQFSIKKTSETLKKGRRWFISLKEGLALNRQLHPTVLLAWVVKQLEEYFSLDREPKIEKEVVKSKYLIPISDAREIAWMDKKPNISENRNVLQFLVTELSFSCLHFLLKRGGIPEDFLMKLDEIVPYLSNGLEASSKFVNTIAMKCFLFLLELDLESFKDDNKREGIWKSVFITMNKHCYKSSSDIEMINCTFKFMSSFCSRFESFKLTKNDFDLILRCVNMYLNNDNCSSSALSLLKRILRNKLKSEELEALMEEIAKNIITSPYKHVNEGCREVYLEYLNIYCTTPKTFKANLEFFINQLNYENFEGRLSAIEMVNSIINITPQSLYDDVRIIFFIKLIFALDIEVIEECRKRLSYGLQLLFQKPDPEQEIFKTLVSLLEDDNHIQSQKTLSQVAGIMIEHGGFWKEKSLIQMLETLCKIIEPINLEKLTERAGGNVSQKQRDHALFMSITAIKKALVRNSFGSINEPTHPAFDTILKIFSYLRKDYIKYEHDWVQQIAMTTIQMCLIGGKSNYEDWAQRIEDGSDRAFIMNQGELLELIKDYMGIIRSATNEKIRESALSGLATLLPIISRLKNPEILQETINMFRIMVNIEVRKDPQNSQKRLAVMYAFGHLIENSPLKAVQDISKSIVRILVREISDAGSPAAIKKLAEELAELLRSKIGDDLFNTFYSEYTDEFAQKRLGNRAKKREQLVLNPEKNRKRKAVSKAKGKKKFRAF